MRLFWAPLALLFVLLGAYTAQAAEPSLAYVLQADRLAPSRSAALTTLRDCGRAILVIDESFANDAPWTATEIAELRAAEPGRRVLAYLSIGEAESYRDYWKPDWKTRPPTWLLAENPDWPGNFRVCYWNEEWQALIINRLNHILEAGFDGIYLDIVDGFEGFEYDPATGAWRDELQNPSTSHTYRDDMQDWVGKLATHARTHHPGFWIVPQNATQLLDRPSYFTLIDAIGVEDLFTNGNHQQTDQNTRDRLAALRAFHSIGKPVFVIEYATIPRLQTHARSRAEPEGFSLLLTDRALTGLGHAFIAIQSLPRPSVPSIR